MPFAECNVAQLAASSKTVYYYVVAVLSPFHTFKTIPPSEHNADDHIICATPRQACERVDPTFQGGSLSLFCDDHVAGSRECSNH